MTGWVLVVMIGGFGVPTIEVQRDIPKPQCLAIANAIAAEGQIAASCFGPNGEKINGVSE